MEIGTGVLEWAPDVFWASTPHDLFAAIDGWNEKNGGNKDKSKSSLTRRDVKRLKAMIAES